MQLVRYTPQSLFKFCPEEFNVANGCNTIRVGTLWGFRNEENELLRDEGEGSFEFRVEFGSLTEVEPLWLEQFRLENGAAAIDELSLKDGKTLLSGFRFSGSAVNSWIFCVSVSETAAGNISEAHQSKWRIDGERVQEFGQYLGSLIWNGLSASDLPGELLARNSLSEIQQQLSLNVSFGKVSYVERNKTISEPSDAGVDDLRDLNKRIPFLKPARFADEQEFRYVFSLSYNGEFFSVPEKAKIVTLRPVDRFISPVK